MKLKNPTAPQITAPAFAPGKPPPNQGKRKIQFKLKAVPGSDVFVAGDFNNWSTNSHQLTESTNPGEFSRSLYVEPGVIEYKFIIDGEWHIDTNCTRWATNGIGTLNSVIEA